MVIGHEKQWRFLKRSAEMDKLPHAYLFSGQEKLGKKTLAVEFIKWLFQENLFNPPHPDFIFIEPIEKEIQISQIRELSWKLALKAFSAPFKAVIIDQAHLMNAEAQNCFLKTLEEPRGKTILILITEYPERLFLTILSRCQTLKFYPVNKTEIKNYLKQKGLTEEMAEKVSSSSAGRPGDAIEFLLNPEKLENQKQKIKELIALTDSNLAFRFQYAKALSREPQNLEEILDNWLRYFRKILISIITQPRAKSDYNKFKPYSLLKLKNILKLTQKTIFLISTTNINPRLALEILLMEL